MHGIAMPGVIRRSAVICTFAGSGMVRSTIVLRIFFLNGLAWADYTALPDFQVSLSRRLRHGHRMYVTPFLPLLGRHAYFLIERWLLDPLSIPSSDGDSRDRLLQPDVSKYSDQRHHF
jgi:hypothetical protein